MTPTVKFASMPVTVRKTALTISALSITAALALSACGGVPGGSIAKVDDKKISQKDFDLWMKSFVKQQSGSQPGASAVVPDAPDFKKCIAAARAAEKKLNPVKKGEKAPKPKPDSDYKKTCQIQYEQLRDVVVKFLVQAEWTVGEAKDRGVKLTDKQIRAKYNKDKKDAYPKEKDFKKFLVQKGQTEAQLYFQYSVAQYGDALRKKLLAGTDKVSDPQITAFYNKNKSQFSTPASRDVQVVVTKTAGDAKKVLAKVKGGMTFKAAAKEFSIDKISKQSGGELKGLTQGAQEPALDTAVFSAKKGVINGPVQTSLGFYVFKVVKIVKPKQQPLVAVKEQIKQQIVQERQSKILEKVNKQFLKKWVEKTDCRKGFAVKDLCKNAPKTPAQPKAPPKIKGKNGGGAAQPQIPVPAQ